jgi:hypothetical protein
MNRWHLSAIVILAGLLFIAVSYVKEGQPISLEMLLSSAFVAGILAAIIWVFDRWLWRMPFLHPWFVSFPNINGRWAIRTDISSVGSGKTDTSVGVATIDQRFFSIRASVAWEDGSRSQFLQRVPVAANGSLYSFAAVVQEFPNRGGFDKVETRTSGYFFTEPAQRPKNLTLFFATDNQNFAKVELDRK